MNAALLAVLTAAACPVQARAEQGLSFDKPVLAKPNELPPDMTLAVLAVVNLLRGKPPAGDSGVVLRKEGFKISTRDAPLFRRSRLEGYSLNVILPRTGAQEGRQLAGALYFRDALQLRMTVNFAVAYSFGDNKIVIERAGARLVTPEHPRVKTFFVRSRDFNNTGNKRAQSLREFLDAVVPVAVDLKKVKPSESGYEPYLVISVFFDRMPQGEAVDLRISYSPAGPAYKPAWAVRRNFDGWHVVGISEYINMTDGPAKYFHLVHTTSAVVNGKHLESERLIHAFTPANGGRRLITPDLAALYRNKDPVSLNKPAPSKGKATLGMAIKMKGILSTAQKVYAKTPAYKAGIRAGDEIIAINGMIISSLESLKKADIRPGRHTEIIYRKKSERALRSAVVMPMLVSR